MFYFLDVTVHALVYLTEIYQVTRLPNSYSKLLNLKKNLVCKEVNMPLKYLITEWDLLKTVKTKLCLQAV